MTNTSFYNHWAGRLLLLASLFCWPIHDWAQEITGDMRTRQEKRIKDRLQEFYDNCVVACMDRDYDFIEAIGKKHTLPGGAFKPDFGKFNEDGLWSFRNYCDNFIGLYGSIFEDGEMMEFRQSDIHFLSLKMVDGGNNVEANFTYTSQLYAGEQLIISAQKVEALLVISMMDPSDYRFKQIVPNQPVTVHYSPEEEKVVPEKEEIPSRQAEIPVKHENQGEKINGIRFHKVRSGDTFSKIARKHGVTIMQLCKLNNINTRTALRLGQLLRLDPEKEDLTQSVEIPTVNVSDLKNYHVINGHEYVDLGLSVKWATCNVGASTPSDYGYYFAWGEIKPKEKYTKRNSVTYKKNIGDIGGNAQYDAARANWGGSWRLPTLDEIEELKSKCKWTWTTQDGHNGYKVVGPSGKSIFLPAAGSYDGALFGFVGESGYCWSSTPNENNTQDAYYLYFYSNIYGSNYGWYCSNRYKGASVRPVSD